MCTIFSHDMARYLIVFLHTYWRLETFVSMHPWICSCHYLWWSQN